MSVDFLRRRGVTRVAVAATFAADPAAYGADGYLGKGETGDYDGVVIVDEANFRNFMRTLAPMQAKGALIIPLNPDWVVPAGVRATDALQSAWDLSAPANYVARCGLRGHYLEFGTFWGGYFCRNYYQFRHWLQGRFIGFDSFAGLSAPLEQEIAYSAGDFTEGSYICNRQSFEAIAELCGIDLERFQAVEGYYSESLVGKDPAIYGLEPRSVSVCIIDCDLYEPTTQVLAFLAPLLDDGALLYFDDWRLTRASPHVGERAAALEWLTANPSFELIDFPGDTPPGIGSWQGQWFIFQRR